MRGLESIHQLEADANGDVKVDDVLDSWFSKMSAIYPEGQIQFEMDVKLLQKMGESATHGVVAHKG